MIMKNWLTIIQIYDQQTVNDKNFSFNFKNSLITRKRQPQFQSLQKTKENVPKSNSIETSMIQLFGDPQERLLRKHNQK